MIVDAAPPFSFFGVVHSHGWYDLPPFRLDEPSGTLAVVAREKDSPVEVRFRAQGHGVSVESTPAIPAPRLRALARRVFSLDVDLSEFLRVAAEDSELSWAAARGLGRFLRAPSLWEDAVKMLLTTNCSWAATSGMVVRAIERFGDGGAFPSPEAIARSRAATVNAAVRSGYRTPALVSLARGVASGRIDFSAWEDGRLESAEVRERILALPGFGPYAAEGLLRLIGRHDFFAIDSWTRTRYRELHPGRGALDRSIARRYRRYGRFQGLAFWLDLTRRWHEAPAEGW